MLQLVETVLTKKETKELKQFLENLDVKEMETISKLISTIIKGLEGKAIDENPLYKFTRVNSILERGRYPTYPLLQKQVYSRLVALKYPKICKIFEEWANLEAEGLIGYKGGARAEWVEVEKHQQVTPEQQFLFGLQQQRQQEKKRRFWQRKPKEPETEFVNE